MRLEALQATAGRVFPQHPAVGLQGSVPLIGPLELRRAATLGFGRAGERDDATAWTTERLSWLAGGVGAGF